MDNEPEVIRHQMDETRSALSEKLEMLEQQVSDTVTGAAETVENVKHAVEHTVQSVKDTVRETVETVQDTLDLRKQVERHPWTMMAGATAVGFVGGALLMRSDFHVPAIRSSSRSRSMSTGNGHHNGNGHSEDYPPAARQQSDDGFARSESRELSSPSSFAAAWQPAVDKLKGLAVGAIFGIVRDLVKKQIPAALESQVAEAIDGITTAFGGKPIAGSLVPCPSGSCDESSGKSFPSATAKSASGSYRPRQTSMSDIEE